MALIRQRKLTKQQLRRIDAQHQQGQKTDDAQLMHGTVMAHYGKQLEVQVTSLPDAMPTRPTVEPGEPEPFWQPIVLNDIWRCHTRTNLPMLATGDKVRWTADPNTGFGRIESMLPRTSLISRPDRYHNVKPVASNVDILAIVFCALPAPAPSLIDRYLVVCHHANVVPLLVLNKADLLDGSNTDVKQLLDEYVSLGYAAVVTSVAQTDEHASSVLDSTFVANASTGLDDIRRIINHKLVIFAGQSGVGKSTLTNALLPAAKQSVNVISQNSKLGQHTTTTSRLLPFDPNDLQQGGIVDTPGIREYGIWHLEPNDILDGFVELAPLSGLCQFRDCQHTKRSKGCGMWQAVANGEVLSRRVESLVALQQEADTQTYH